MLPRRAQAHASTSGRGGAGTHPTRPGPVCGRVRRRGGGAARTAPPLTPLLLLQPTAAAAVFSRMRPAPTPRRPTPPASLPTADSDSDDGMSSTSTARLVLSEPASRTLVDLASAWDVLAPRLPALLVADAPGGGVLLEALKLAVAGAAASGSSAPLAAGAALGTAARLADLAAQGLPLDVPSIAAGIVADAAAAGTVSLAAAADRLGGEAAGVLDSVLKVRALPRRVDIYDDAASSALRELALTFYDARACMVEVAARAAGLETLTAEVERGGHGSGSGPADLQVAALEALQIYAPLGHALGMGPVAAELEDACFRTLFPESYGETARWLRAEADACAAGLEACRSALGAALAADPALSALADGCEIHARTKSLFSTMKKLLRLDDFAAGGRERGALFDLLGMRVIVFPRGSGGGGGGASGASGASSESGGSDDGGGGSEMGDAPTDPLAEADASAACYRVLEVAASLWEVLPGRTKDYIGSPKENGYRSLHATLRPGADLFGATVEIDGGGGGGSEGGSPPPPPPSSSSPSMPTVELQIRTAAMHASAECGDAAHTAYKGGLARRQAAALAAWSARSAAALASASSTSSLMGSVTSSSDSDDGSGVAPATVTGPPLTSSAEALFRHLDVDGDGTVSAAELERVLRDMGSGDGAAAAAAADLVRAAKAGTGGAADPGGPLTLAEFSELFQRASVVASLPAVDAATAESLRRVGPPQEEE